MVFKPSFKQNVFEFQLSGSKKTFSMPLRQYISADLAERLEETASAAQPMIKKIQDAQALATETGEDPVLPDDFNPEMVSSLSRMQRELFEKYAPGSYAAGTKGEIQEVMQEWGRVSNIELGESSASSNS